MQSSVLLQETFHHIDFEKYQSLQVPFIWSGSYLKVYFIFLYHPIQNKQTNEQTKRGCGFTLLIKMPYKKKGKGLCFDPFFLKGLDIIDFFCCEHVA